MTSPPAAEFKPKAKKEVVMGMRIGYARVSSAGQKLDVQMDRLTDCDRTFYEKASGASAKDRPELQKALDFVRDEDIFVVTKLDRLARVFWFSVNWRIPSFELDYANGGIHHAKKAA